MLERAEVPRLGTHGIRRRTLMVAATNVLDRLV
jgi:hypothetical protein